MPVFPISYNEQLPPAAGQNVPARLNTDTGAGEVAASLTRAGGEIASTASNIMGQIVAAENSTELDTRRRVRAQNWNALQETLANERDPDKRQAAFDKYQKDNENIQGGRNNPFVDRTWKSELSQVVPHEQAVFMHGQREVRIKNVVEESQINDSQDFAIGDKVNYMTRQHKLLALGIIGQAQFDANAKNFDTMFMLTKAHNDISSENPASIKAGVETLSNIDDKKLTPEQLDDKHKLTRAGTVEINRVQADNYNKFFDPLIKVLGSNAVDAVNADKALSGELDKAQVRGDITPQQNFEMKQHSRVIVEHKLAQIETPYGAEAVMQAHDIVDSVGKELTDEEYKTRRAELIKLSDKLPEKQLPVLWHDLNENRQKAIRSSGALKVMTQNVIESQSLDLNDASKFRTEVSQYKTELAGMSDADRLQFLTTKAVLYKAKKAQEIAAKPEFTPAKIEEMTFAVHKLDAELKSAIEEKDAFYAKYPMANETARKNPTAKPTSSEGKIRDERDKIQGKIRAIGSERDVLYNRLQNAEKPAAAGIPTVNTDAEYDALPSGSPYFDTADGKTKKKKSWAELTTQ